jgi:hypothetical protein
MVNEFHFVLKKELKEKIKAISKNSKMNISKTIIFIIKIMKPLLERYFYQELKDKRGEYQRFNATDHLHINFDERSYKILKHITDNLNIFSMAITLRKILEIFIKLVDKIGIDKVVEKLKRIRRIHLRKMGKINKIIKNMENRQLSMFRKDHMQNFTYKLVFNRYYDIICIEFSH